MKYLVTGGAGFIGSNIVGELLKKNETVRVIDNFSTGKRENISQYMDTIELIEGDIRSYHIVAEAVDGIDFILHQAALPSVPRSIKDPITSDEVNVGGTLNILEAARDAKVKRIGYASSSSIYGDSVELPKHEDMTPNPLSPYTVSKLAAENYCRVFSRIFNLETVCLRYFNVFGPRQDPNSQYSAVIPKFIQAMLNDKAPVIYGDGTQTRDFTYVSNVAEANLLASTAECDSGIVLNCACNERTELNRLVFELNAILGKDIKPMYVDPRPGDVMHSFASVEKAKKTINYEPGINFKDGLRKTVEWYADSL